MENAWRFGAIVFAALLAISIVISIVPSPWSYGLLIALTAALFYKSHRDSRMWETLGAGTDERLVSVTYRSDGGHDALDFGRDVGFLTVVDGWLHFRGLRSDWSISRNDGFAVRDRVFVRLFGGDLILRVRGREVKDSSIRTLLAGWSYGERVEGDSRLPNLPVSRQAPWCRASDAVYPIVAILLALGLRSWVPSYFEIVPYGVADILFCSILMFIVCAGPLYSAVILLKTRRARWRCWQAAPPEASRPGLLPPMAAPPSRNRNPRPADIVIR